ncbi:hypothetical protein GGR56DRAFT_660523, partial [Xylariaceae sp. FL0804]
MAVVKASEADPRNRPTNTQNGRQRGDDNVTRGVAVDAAAQSFRYTGVGRGPPSVHRFSPSLPRGLLPSGRALFLTLPRPAVHPPCPAADASCCCLLPYLVLPFSPPKALLSASSRLVWSDLPRPDLACWFWGCCRCWRHGVRVRVLNQALLPRSETTRMRRNLRGLVGRSGPPSPGPGGTRAQRARDDGSCARAAEQMLSRLACLHCRRQGTVSLLASWQGWIRQMKSSKARGG